MSRWFLFAFALLLQSASWASGADFTLQAVDGGKHSLSDYRGKWVVVNYWATWCPPCREEMPALVHFHEAHKNKDAVVLGINMEEEATRERLQRFAKEFAVTYPILRSRPEMELGPIDGLPTTYLVAPDGRVVAHQLGAISEESIESFIASYKPAK